MGAHLLHLEMQGRVSQNVRSILPYPTKMVNLFVFRPDFPMGLLTTCIRDGLRPRRLRGQEFFCRAES
jgi:hypothetical protein